MDERLRAYVARFAGRDHPLLERLRAATDRLELGDARTPLEEAALIAFLVELIGARRILEIGTFTGHGTLAMALAMGADGRIVTLDADERWPAIGRPFWREAGVEERIEVRLGHAIVTLDVMIDRGETDEFDLVFIDADKKSYDPYYERALRLVRPGGLILVDNTLWHGTVADPADHTRQATAIRALNTKILGDPRVAMVLLPIADGVTLVRRR